MAGRSVGLSPLRLVWDLEERENELKCTVIKCGDKVIWREPAVYEGYERFAAVVSILKRKYGERLRDVQQTPASELFLYGDELSAPRIVRDIRTELAGGPKE